MMNAHQSVPAVPAREDLGIEAELRRARILLDVAERCASINDLDGVLHELVTLTSRALECDRGTLFLNDAATGELYSRVAQGNLKREIRILNTTGIAGHVFQAGVGLVIDDPYHDPRFNASVDERTGMVVMDIVADARDFSQCAFRTGRPAGGKGPENTGQHLHRRCGVHPRG